MGYRARRYMQLGRVDLVVAASRRGAGAVCAGGTVGDAAVAAAVGVTGLPTGGGSGPLDGASGAAATATGTSRLNRNVINTAHAVRRPKRVSATCSRVVMRPSLRVR